MTSFQEYLQTEKKDEQPKNWVKYVIQQARTLQSQLQGWANQLQQYRTVKTMKDIQAQDLNKAGSEMVRVAKKM
ncbi:MAG: hypothetical protein EA424_03715 [Planctomycetaceae bacterium]|nr:MAG: hypothetical protein EA424_03715 [Planctomycetaceae bacterium]